MTFLCSKSSRRCDEHGGRLVHLGEGYLVIARVGIQKTQELAPGLEIYDLVYASERKRIFWTSLLRARVVNTRPPFPILFRYKNWVGIQSGCWTSLTKPAVKSFSNSSPMVLRFSSLKRRRPCLTGLDPGFMLRVCSETSQKMPDMSVGLHTKMALLHRRKSMSLPSYFRFKPAPI
jgi:hypothetical protein